MTASLLLAPPAAGKTHACLQQVRAQLEAEPLSPVWVVLPDRRQVAAFRLRLAEQGGAMGAEVGTFGDLYKALLREAGQSVPLASELIVHSILRSAIDVCTQTGQLRTFAPIAHTPGFLRVMRERIAELKRGLVLPERMLEGRPQESAQVDIGRIYALYQAKLKDLGWEDGEGVNWLATAAIKRHPHLAAHWRLIIFDGFDSFYGSQLATLQLLAERVNTLLITLPGDVQQERGVHRRFLRAREQLQAAIGGLAILSLDVVHQPIQPLHHLQDQLFAESPIQGDPQDAVRMLEVRTPVEEAREAMRWIKARICRDGVPIRSCALVIPDPESYRPYLREAAEEFGVPLRFTQREPLAKAPAVVALLDLIALPLHSWPRRLTIEAVRTPYLDLRALGLEQADSQALELASLHGQVLEGLDQWQETLLHLARRGEEHQQDPDDAHPFASLPRGDRALALWQGLERLADRLQPPVKATIKHWVHWLEDVLADLRFFEQMQLPRDRAAAKALRETLRAMVLGETVAGEIHLSPEAFFQDLSAALESASYEELFDWSTPAINVLRVLEARGLRYQAVAVLGLSEGLFPEVERIDPFLGEGVRAQLGLDLRLGREQAGLFYHVVTRSDRFLLLTRPYLASGGEAWEPSPFWNAVLQVFGEIAEKLLSESPQALQQAASSQELLFHAVRRRGLPPGMAGGDHAQRWQQLQHARDVLNARMAAQVEGPYDGSLKEIQSILAQRYHREHIWSASRLETYGTCPFFFYASQALGLEPQDPPQPGFDAAQLGSMLHAILEKTYEMLEPGVELDAILQQLEIVARHEFEAAPQNYGFRPTPLWQIEQDQLLEMLAKTVQALESTKGNWQAIQHEAAFGMGGLPPLEIPLSDGLLYVRGYIDRLDRDPKGRLRVIDYKTGGSHLSSADLIEGRRLQLPLYALAAERVLGLGTVSEGFYWNLRRAEAGSLKLKKFKVEWDGEILQGPEGAARMALMHIGRYLEQIRAGNFAPLAPRGGCPSYCPAALWCWRYDGGGWS